MKKHPIITELQLGKSVEEVISEHFEYDFEEGDVQEMLPEIVREIVRIGRADLRFAVDVGIDSCGIVFLNAESGLNMDYYWDDEGHWPRTGEAEADCGILNEIVERLYGTERKRPKPRFTKEQFVRRKGNICPYCGGKKIIVLDGETYTNHDEMGCQSCGEVWERKHKKVVTGFR